MIRLQRNGKTVAASDRLARDLMDKGWTKITAEPAAKPKPVAAKVKAAAPKKGA